MGKFCLVIPALMLPLKHPFFEKILFDVFIFILKNLKCASTDALNII